MNPNNVYAGPARKRSAGRPKKTVIKHKKLVFYVTDLEYQLIAKKAKDAGISKSEWIRKSAKKTRIVARLKPEEARWFRSLSDLSNALLQLARLADASALPSFALKCHSTIVKINDLFNQFIKHDRQA